MANMQFANNATTTLLSGITNVATSLTVASGKGALFPALAGSQYFYCTLANVSTGAVEIVKVTARATDVFTIVRAQDGTSAVAWNAGDTVELRLVAAVLNDIPKLDEPNTFTAVQTPMSGTAAVSTTSTFAFNPATHGQVCTVTLTNAITVTLSITASSLVAGTTYRIKLKAGDTNARTFAKDTTIKVSGGSALPITSGTTTTNGIDHFVFVALDASTAECVGGTADVR